MDNNMSDMMENISKMLNNKDVSDNLKNMLNNFTSNSDNTQNTNSSNNSQNDSNNDTNANFNNENNETTENSNPFSNIDFETIMKMKNIFDKVNTKKNDPRTNLLLSLKPYLKESRKDKVDKYIQFLNMSQVLESLNPLGGEKSK